MSKGGDELLQRRLAAILSADAAGYTRLMGADEEATVRTLSEYRDAIAAVVAARRGRIVDMPGDNVLAEFGSAVDAVEAALAMQRDLGERNATLPEERRMSLVRNCTTNEAIATFRGSQAMHRGGTLSDTNAGAPSTRGPGWGVWSLVGQSLASGVFGVVTLWSVASWRPGLAFRCHHFRQLSLFGVYIVGFKLLNVLSGRIDALLIVAASSAPPRSATTRWPAASSTPSTRRSRA